MNLFQYETTELLEKYVSKDWAESLSQYIDMETFKSIGKKVAFERQNKLIYPEHKDIFKALKYDLDKVKVVIVGQDPYYNGNADGLAFSCKESLSPSLTQIIEAIFSDNFTQNESLKNFKPMYFRNKYNYNLEYLAQQGVLLYNPTLTVEAEKPNSHKGLWNTFSDAVFKSLSNGNKSIVWMMWGNDAKESVSKSINGLDAKNKHYFLYNEHPAAASYRKQVWKCNHFTLCNKWLKEYNLTEIEWLQR